MNNQDPGNIYSVIGLTLVYLQSFERSIKFCTTFVLQGEAELNWERLQNLEKDEGKKALGHFIRKIKERAELHPSFADLLSSVLHDRNDFIHNTDKIPGWNLHTPEGSATALAFSMSLLRRAHRANELLAALVLRWQEQTAIYVEEDPEQEAYRKEIESRYGHLVELLFFHREA